jgi:hypothetical protein
MDIGRGASRRPPRLRRRRGPSSNAKVRSAPASRLARPRAFALSPPEAHPQSPPHPGFCALAKRAQDEPDRGRGHDQEGCEGLEFGGHGGQNPSAVPAWYTMNDKIQAAPVM